MILFLILLIRNLFLLSFHLHNKMEIVDEILIKAFIKIQNHSMLEPYFPNRISVFEKSKMKLYRNHFLIRKKFKKLL